MSILSALFPILILLSVGTFLKSAKLVSAEAWRGVEWLGYYLLLPALIIKVLANAPSTFDARFVIVLLAAQVSICVVSLVALRLSRHSGPRSGAILQSNVRWNTFVALALADALFAQDGLALVALGSAVLIPLANIFSVGGFLHFAGAKRSYLAMFKSLSLNPLLIACVVGLSLWGSGADIPPLLLPIVDLFSRSAITLGLLAAGAGLSFAHLSSSFIATVFWSAFRLLVFPTLALLFCLAFGLDKFETMIAVICSATPTAVNGYILAKELGGDHVFSANLIAMQTVLSLATLPLFITLTAMFAPA